MPKCDESEIVRDEDYYCISLTAVLCLTGQGLNVELY